MQIKIPHKKIYLINPIKSYLSASKIRTMKKQNKKMNKK